MVYHGERGCWLLVFAVVLEASTPSAGELLLARRLEESTNVDDQNRPDFSIEGETSFVASEEVIKGTIVVEGSIPTGIVADISLRLRSTMARAVGFDSVVSEVMGTLTTAQDGRIWQSITFEYVILPTPGSADQVLASLQGVLPSANQQGSPFREIFKWESALSTSLQSADVAEWTITAANPSVLNMEVRRPTNLNTHTTYAPSPLPAPPPSLASTMPPWGNGGGTTAAPSDRCELWGSPCLCALTPACSWDVLRGCSSAAPGSNAAAVGCTACPVQPHCAAAVCGAALDACACAESPVGCNWDAPRGRCEERGGGPSLPISCTACARQDGCNPPELRSLLPLRGSLLGPGPSGPGQSTIHATFDRNVSLCSNRPSGTLAQLHCDLSVVPVALGRERLSVAHQELTIQVPDTTEHFTSNCSLEILERVVCGLDGVPFLGLMPGGYHVLLGEASPPNVLSTRPPNTTAGNGAALPLTVSIFFTERVRLTGSAGGLAARLEKLDGGPNPSRQLSLVPGNVEVFGEEVWLDFGSIAEERTDYSLVFPAGALEDWAGNPFPGLALGEYVLRTGRPTPEDEVAPSEDSGLPTLAIVGIASGAALLLAVVVYAVIRCRGKPLRRNLSRNWSWSSNPESSNSRGSEAVRNSASLSIGWIFGGRVSLPKSERPPAARSAW